MSVSGVGGSDSNPYSSIKPKSSAQDAIQDFLKIANQSPAERMQDMWLKSHNLSKEKLASMTPEQREIVMKQMAEDIKKQMQQDAANKAKASGKVDILA